MKTWLTYFRFRNFSFWFWGMLTYIIAALIWWFISLESQNRQMTRFRLERLNTNSANYEKQTQEILSEQKRNTTKYISEGITFLALLLFGALVVYRSFRRRISYIAMQQNFMMAVTHELKTPIATTRLSLETILHRKLEESQQQKLLQNALAETGRLDVLTNNILLASQVEESGGISTATPFSLTALLEQTLKEYGARFSARNIEASVEKDIWINGEEKWMQIAVSNLVDNALKYAPKETPVSVRLHTDVSKAVLSVADEGSGIPQAEKKKIFYKFYRIGNEITRTTKGTGLGLYLTQKIIAKHHGRIYVKDNLPKGSIFVIEIPLYAR